MVSNSDRVNQECLVYIPQCLEPQLGRLPGWGKLEGEGVESSRGVFTYKTGSWCWLLSEISAGAVHWSTFTGPGLLTTWASACSWLSYMVSWDLKANVSVNMVGTGIRLHLLIGAWQGHMSKKTR